MQTINRDKIDFGLVVLDYVYKVRRNWPTLNKDLATVCFGNSGTGKHPNYQIQPDSGAPITYTGNNHERDEYESEYEKGHLTDTYHLDELEKAFDVALKSEDVAQDYLYQLHRESPEKCPRLNPRQKKIVIRKIMNGAPIEQTIRELFLDSVVSA